MRSYRNGRSKKMLVPGFLKIGRSMNVSWFGIGAYFQKNGELQASRNAFTHLKFLFDAKVAVRGDSDQDIGLLNTNIVMYCNERKKYRRRKCMHAGLKNLSGFSGMLSVWGKAEFRLMTTDFVKG